jgi:hypothetical protein
MVVQRKEKIRVELVSPLIKCRYALNRWHDYLGCLFSSQERRYSPEAILAVGDLS